jgi:hypothetical protein
MANCQLIKNQLDLLVEERDAVEEGLETTTNPTERANLIFELKSLNHQIATKLSQYNACLHPPPPKPDLVAKTFQIKPNHSARTLEVACVIQNDGDGPARGPFEVVLGVSYTDQAGTKITRQLNIHVPNGVTIEGHGTQYVTEPIQNIPLLYRDDNPAFVYLLEMIVDSMNQMAETSESNNYLGTTYWTVHPPST